MQENLIDYLFIMTSDLQKNGSESNNHSLCLFRNMLSRRNNPHKYLVLANRLDLTADTHIYLYIVHPYSFVNNSTVNNWRNVQKIIRLRRIMKINLSIEIYVLRNFSSCKNLEKRRRFAISSSWRWIWQIRLFRSHG